MAIALASLVNYNSQTNAASYTTGTYTPTANALVIAVVASRDFTTLAAPSSVSGNGLTWVEVQSDVGHNPNNQGIVYRAMGASPTTEGFTANFDGNQEECTIIVCEATGVDTSGTNGSGAVVQSVKATALTTNPVTATLAAFADAVNNVALGVFLPGSGSTWTADATWAGTDLVEQDTAPDVLVAYKLGQSDPKANYGLTLSKWAVGMELQVASGGSSDVLIQGLHGIGRGLVAQTAAGLGGVLQG